MEQHGQSVPPVIPVRLERYDEAPPRQPPRQRFWLNPISGLVILAIDWFFFASEAMSGGLALPFACFFAFLLTTTIVFRIQRRKSGDPFGAAMTKALFAGVLAGLPTSIGGTLLATLVLVLSGLRGPVIGTPTDRKQPAQDAGFTARG